MAKELPYFKFEPNQWENGNIQICNREDKGLFIDLCSMYWSRLGDLPIKLAIQRLCNGNATAFNLLIEENIFKVIDGQICIDFLNEQLVGFESLSATNTENARLGWEKRRKNATALNPQSDGNAIREDKSKEDKIKENKEIKLKKEIDFVFLGELKNIRIESENETVLHNRYPKQKLDFMIKKLDSWLQTKNKKCDSFKSLIAYFNNWVEESFENSKPQLKNLQQKSGVKAFNPNEYYN